MKSRPQLALLALLALLARPASGQDAIRVHPVGDPRPGREAPDFTLPVAQAEEVGTTVQPFLLRAELGRVVVLAFCPEATDSATVTLLRTLGGRQDSLFAGEVVVVGILREPAALLLETARANALPYKLLSDSTERVRRAYGVERREVGVYVVGPAGRVEWRERRFNPFLATSYERLREAVQRAGGTQPTR